MSTTLTLPIGQNVSIDGGPFPNFEGHGRDPGAINPTVYGRDESTEMRLVALVDIEDAIANEIRTGEPVHLSTGDVGDGATVGTIEVPCIPGYFIEIHCLPGQGVDRRANLGNLDDDELRRKSFERKAASRGATID